MRISPEKLVESIPEDSWLKLWLNAWPTTEMPWSYLLFGALTTLGAALGRKVWFEDDYRKIYSMLNLLLIGPSGIGKSSAIELNQTLLLQLEAKDRPQFIIGSASPEKLHEDLVLQPHAILYASELANFFNRQRYMEGMIPYMCCPPETPVLCTDLTWRKVGSLVVGDTIIGFDENGGGQGVGRYFHKSTVEATGRKTLPCVELETDYSTTVTSTEHLFIVKKYFGDVWCPANLLREGDKIRYFGKPWETDTSEKAAYLSALFDGEGHVGRDYLGFTQNEGTVLTKGEAYLTALGFKTNRYDHEHVKDKCKVVKVLGGLYERLSFLGRCRPVRLLENADKAWEDRRISEQRTRWATIKSVKHIGDREVVPLQTSTRTLISDGYFTHNTELLDCRPIERRTKSGNIQRIEAPETTVVGGSTTEWLQDALPDSAVGGGFLPRFLIVKEDSRRQRVPNAEMALSKQEWKKTLAIRDEAYAEFKHVVACASGAVRFGDYGVNDQYSRWYLAHATVNNHLAPFAARAPEMVKRLAMLVAISCHRENIAEEDLKAAIKLYGYAESKLAEVVIPKSPQGKLLALVQASIPPSGITAEELFHSMKSFLPAGDVEKYLFSLLRSGDVEQREGKFYLKDKK